MTGHDVPATGPVAPVSADAVEEAAQRLVGVATRTPLERSVRLSRLTGLEVWLKREDLQPVRSYKVRGAYNFMTQLDAGTLARGVVCASAGNHGQGVALSCARLRARGRIYVPTTTPRQKRDRISALGEGTVEVVIAGDTYEEASRAASDDAARSGATLVPAYDDPRTICGQGTVAIEVVDQLGRAPDALLVPVGGGGLLAGTTTWLRGRGHATRIVGVEPAGAACMAAAVAAGHPVDLATVDTFVDGAAVRRAGDHTFGPVRDHGVELVRVDEGRACTEMLDLYQSDGIIAEPAGALATAALPTLGLAPSSTVVCVVSGGNNDVSRYGEVLERSLVHRGLKHYFLVSFPQEPGALRRFLDEVLGPDDDITLFEYVKRNNRELGPALIGIELADRDDLAGLRERLAQSPVSVEPVESGSALFHFLL